MSLLSRSLAFWRYARARRPSALGPTSPPVSPPVRTPVRRSTGVLRLYAREPVTLDPALAGDANSTEFIDKIFSGLVALNEKLEIVPELAENWDVSEGGKVYTFHLRDGLKFQDGAPVTADDFKYSVERLTDPATGSQVASSYVGDIVGAADKLAGQAKEVKGVEVVDPRTIRITIDAPKAYFLSKLSYHTFFIVDRRNVEQGGNNWWLKPNGTGPFKLASISKDAVVLTSNQVLRRRSATDRAGGIHVARRLADDDVRARRIGCDFRAGHGH